MIVIAHRLATVIDADRILVMSDGYGLEFDHPYKLLVDQEGDDKITRKEGQFSSLVQATNEETSQSLF